MKQTGVLLFNKREELYSPMMALTSFFLNFAFRLFIVVRLTLSHQRHYNEQDKETNLNGKTKDISERFKG